MDRVLDPDETLPEGHEPGTRVTDYAAPRAAYGTKNWDPANPDPGTYLGMRTMTVRTNTLSGVAPQDVLLDQPVYDITPAAQDCLNDATAARDAAVTAKSQAQTSATQADTSSDQASVSAGQADTAKLAAQTARDGALTAQLAAEAAKTGAENAANDAETNSGTAANAEHLAWLWAEKLDGPTLTEAEYAAIDPALKPPGYFYNPVGGVAGLWSAHWWAIKASEESGYAGDAAASAEAAAESAAEAAASAEAAANQLQNTYYGALDYVPAVDPDGNPIDTGDLYYNTSTDILYVWGGSSWVAVNTAPGTVGASSVSFAPGGDLGSTNVQAALIELDTEKVEEAPTDGGSYARQNGGWVSASAPVIEWDNVTGKPSTFPPSAHVHPISEVTGLQAALDAESSARSSADTTLTTNLSAEVTARTNADTTLTTNLNAEVTNRVADVDAEEAARIAADNTLQTNINAKIGDAPSDGFQYVRKNAAWSQSVSGATISATPPSSPIPGQLWWEADTGNLFVYYDDGNSQAWVQANYTYDPSLLLPKTGGTLTGNLTIDPPTGNAELIIDKTELNSARLRLTKGGLARWYVSATGDAESGSNAGSDFAINRYDDAGGFLETVLRIARPTGLITANIAQPAVFAHRSGAGSVSLSTGAWTKVNLGTLSSNVGGWTLSGGALVVPKAGIYFIHAGLLMVATTTANGTYLVGISRNGALTPSCEARGYHSVANNVNYSINCGRIFGLNAGDTLELIGFTSLAGWSINDANTDTFMNAFMVAAQ